VSHPPIPDRVITRARLLGEWLESRSDGDSDRAGATFATANTLFDEMRALLVRLAAPTGGGHQVLSSSVNEIWDLLKLLSPQDALAPKTEAALRDVESYGKRSVILGGGLAKRTNFDRNPAIPHLRRLDGAWFDFRFIVEDRPAGTPLAILAYNCEVRFPTSANREGPSWLRLDLNLPGQRRANDGLRAHLHPSTDEWSIPAPKVTPLEALDVLVWRTRNQGPIQETLDPA
jgi:hypothetical protein